MTYASLFAGIGGLQELEDYDMINEWQINTQQVPYLMGLRNSISKVLLKRKSGISSEYHKKWYSVGSKNLALNPVSQLKEINGESLTICGKVIRQLMQQSIIGLKNSWVSQVSVRIAVAKTLNIGERMGGLISVTLIGGK